MRLLLVEDDPLISTNVKTALVQEGHAVDTAFTHAQGLQKSQDESYDLFVIDWLLPDTDGLSLIHNIRFLQIHSPILLLTAKNQPADIAHGLDSGADDYLTKPFDTLELLARIRALLRRKPHVLFHPILKIGDLFIDTNTHQVKRQRQTINLSPKEYSLVHYLATNPDTAIDRLTILSHVWDEQADLFSNTVDVHIRYLRKKIDDPFKHKLIKTVKGKGYMLCSK